MGTTTPNLSPEDFILRGMVALREPGKKYVLARTSGLNRAFRQHFGEDVDVREVTKQLRLGKRIAVFLGRNDVLLYMRDELKESTRKRHDAQWAERDDPSKEPGDDCDALSKIKEFTA